MILSEMDQQEFGAQVENYRHELQVHCYRLMGSVQDAEDMVQETFLRAWHRRETYEGRASLRAWLYRIATNLCIDALRQRKRRYVPVTREAVSTLNEPIPAEVNDPVWLEPYPDHLLPAEDHDPEERLSAQENITLAFIAALHLLPPRQRAVLVLCDVLDWKARETAAIMETSVSAVKSALYRARSTLAVHDPRSEASPEMLDDALQTRLNDFVHAWERADVNALISLLTDDATFSMPPIPSWYQGKESIRGLVSMTVFRGGADGRWRLLPTRANGQAAFGLYRQMNDGSYNGYGIQVLTFHGRLLADITTFRNPALFAFFKLPTTLS